VDVSNDGGATWVNVENTNVSGDEWTPIEVDLNLAFGAPPQLVKLRFIASDYDPQSQVEAGVDDFMLFVDYQSAGVEESSGDQGPRFSLLPVRPNPSGGSVDIGFTIPAGAPVKVSIHDVSGRLVRVLADGTEFADGRHVVRWDGTNETGRNVAAGVYYVRFVSGGFSASRKLVFQSR
jgi:hypothetical protein